MLRSESPLWSAGFTKDWWKGLSLAERIAIAGDAQTKGIWTDEQVELFSKDWRIWAHDYQLAPTDPDWKMWVLLMGRGTGKTRTAVETVRDLVYKAQSGRVCLLGQGADDVRDVMIEGEALALDTPIPTPSGWTVFGDLQPGDEVFARDGSVTRVAGVTPVWFDRPCYAVTADGAESVVADERHLWVTSSRSERRPDRPARGESNRTTGELAAGIRKRRSDLCEYEIPMAGGLNLPDAELPVPPYTLGAWLGDGDTRGQGAFTCHEKDVEIVDQIRADGFEVRKQSGIYAWGIRRLKRLLVPAGLSSNKHIPDAYMRASAAQRLALLQGLMDTDGYVSERGQCAFDNTNLALVKSVRELLLTLGFKPGAVQSRKPPRGETCFRLTFTSAPGLPIPFRLKRKTDRCISAKRAAGRLVRKIEKVASVPVRCIQVEHPSGTFLAGRDFVVTHNSGFLATAPSWFRPTWSPSRGILEWPNGALAYVYSAEDPEALRGPQFDLAWVDEVMAFKAEARKQAESNLRFGLRLGRNPRRIYTTTPKPHKWIRELVKRIKDQTVLPDGRMSKGLYITRGSTYQNAENLPDSFLEDLRDDYEGTRLGKQELYGEILGDTEGALFQTENLDNNRVLNKPDTTEEQIQIFSRSMERILVAVDPAMKGGVAAHAAGITVHGVRGDTRYLLADRSIRGASPAQWAREVVKACFDYQADQIVAEVNQGGDLVRAVINQIAAEMDVPIPSVRSVHATRGKQRRAEPVAAAYEQNKVKHVGPASRYDKLETQLCELHENYDPTEEDFDRADSVVWGQTWLAKKSRSTSSSGVGTGILTMADLGG